MMTRTARASAGFLASWRRRRKLGQVLLYVGLLLAAFVFLFPFYYMLISSFRQAYYNFDRTTLDLSFPWPPHFDGYVRIINTPLVSGGKGIGALLSGFKNTIYLVVVGVGGSTITSVLAAYAFAKHKFPGRDLIFYIFMGSMILPGEVTLVPKYIMFHNWGLLNQFGALLIPGILGAGGWFLMRMFMGTIPDSLLEAARIDGAGELSVIKNVVVPLAKPAISFYMLTAFLGTWNDLMGPLIYVNTPSKWTLQMVLYAIQVSYSFEYGLDYGDISGLKLQTLFAGVLIAALPTIVVFTIFQKRLVEGITITGLKI